MFELIGAGLVGAASMFGFMKSKELAESKTLAHEARLDAPRATRRFFRPGIVGVTVGLATTVLTAGVAAFVPLIGTGAAVVFGAGVGTGTMLGSRRGEKKARILGGDESARS